MTVISEKKKSLTACTRHRSADSTPALRLQACVCWLSQTDGSAVRELVFMKTETWCMLKLNLFSSLSCGGSPQTPTNFIPNAIVYCPVLVRQNKFMLEPKTEREYLRWVIHWMGKTFNFKSPFSSTIYPRFANIALHFAAQVTLPAVSHDAFYCFLFVTGGSHYCFFQILQVLTLRADLYPA